MPGRSDRDYGGRDYGGGDRRDYGGGRGAYNSGGDRRDGGGSGSRRHQSDAAAPRRGGGRESWRGKDSYDPPEEDCDREQDAGGRADDGYRSGDDGARPTKRKKKRKKKDSSSSDSDSPYDWRQEVWKRGFQGAWPMMQMQQAQAAFAWGGRAGYPNPQAYAQQQQYYAQAQQQYAQQGAYHQQQDWESWPPEEQWGAGDKRGRNRDDSPPAKRRKEAKWEDEEDARDTRPVVKAILEPVQESVVDVPRSVVAKVIGKGGAQICTIREKSGAQIDARQQNSDPCKVKLLGTSEAIEKARDMIWDLMELAVLRPGTVLVIPRAKIGKVIGIRGAQINEIQVTTGAKVDVERSGDPCYVTIGGEPDKVEMAKKLVLTLAMEAADDNSEYIDLPKGAAGAVLGVQGARLRELQAQSGARIDVDKTQPNVCRVRIAGTSDQIAHAKELVMLATQAPRPLQHMLTPNEQPNSLGLPDEPQPVGDPSRALERMTLPMGMPGKIIGKAGSTIQSIHAESGARLWVDCETNEVRIQGTVDQVAHAKALVQALVEEGLPQGVDPSMIGGYAQPAPALSYGEQPWGRAPDEEQPYDPALLQNSRQWEVDDGSWQGSAQLMPSQGTIQMAPAPSQPMSALQRAVAARAAKGGGM